MPISEGFGLSFIYPNSFEFGHFYRGYVVCFANNNLSALSINNKAQGITEELKACDQMAWVDPILYNELRLDKLIYAAIPTGFSIQQKPHRFSGEIDLAQLRCYRDVDTRRGELSIGTLGGGKHFIEIRRIIYTTTAISTRSYVKVCNFSDLNRQLRKVTKTKSAFVSDGALLKQPYMVTMQVTDKWTMPIKD